jgi:hypothetical protein
MKYNIKPTEEKKAVLGLPHKGRSSEFVFSALQSRPKEIRKKEVSIQQTRKEKLGIIKFKTISHQFGP